jgi:hypothetical protein
LRYAATRFNHRAAWPAQQCYVLAQAPDDPVLIRHLRATKPENIGRAGHLLFRRPTMFLRRSGPLNNNKAADRYRETLDNPVCCHVCLPLNFTAHEFHTRPASSSQMNETQESSRRTKKCESTRFDMEPQQHRKACRGYCVSQRRRGRSMVRRHDDSSGAEIEAWLGLHFGE